MTKSEGRKFAFPVGGAFIVLAAIGWWRGHVLVAEILGGLGVALGIAGALVPGHLGPVYRAWMGFAHAISKVTTPIFMGIVYYIVIAPIGLLRRVIGGNPMVHDTEEGSFWRTRPEGSRRGNIKRQF